jgi:hypothetical protein
MKCRIVENIEIDQTYYTVERKFLGIFWVSVYYDNFMGNSWPVTYNDIKSAKHDLQKYIAYKNLNSHKNIIYHGDI